MLNRIIPFGHWDKDRKSRNSQEQNSKDDIGDSEKKKPGSLNKKNVETLKSNSSNSHHLIIKIGGNDSPVVNKLRSISAQQYIDSGNKLLTQGEKEEAVACYHQALQIDPNSAQASQHLAVALKQQGKLKEAIDYYRRAINVSNSSLNHSASLGQISSENLPIETTNQKPQTTVTFSSLNLTGEQSQNNFFLLSMSSSNSSKASLVPTKQAVVSKLAAVEVYLQQAEGYCAQGDWEKAVAVCRRVLEVAPQTAEAYKIWGKVLQKQGQPLEAMGYYAKALEIQPNLAEVHVNLGSLYAQQQQWEQAINYYHKAIAINPQFAGAYRNLAKALHKIGNDQEAFLYFYQALSLEPEQATAEEHLELGDELLEQEKFAEAIACYRRAIRVNPGLPEAYQKLADTLSRQGEWQEAASYYQQALQNSESKTATKLLSPGRGQLVKVTPTGELVQQEVKVNKVYPSSAQNGRLQPSSSANAAKAGTQRQIETAIERFTRLVEAQPNSAEAQANLGSAYAKEKRWQDAIASYTKAIKLNPQFAGAYRNLAKVFEQTTQEKKAADCWYQVLMLEPQKAKVQQHLQIGKRLQELGELQPAVNCYRQALRLQPNLAEAYHCLGSLLLEQGQQETAIAVYQQAVRSNPQDGESWYHLAEILAVQGKWEEAKKLYQKAIEVDAGFDLAHFGLANVLTHEEAWEEAIPCYQEAIQLLPSLWRAHHQLGEALVKLERWNPAVSAFRKATELNPEFSWAHNGLGEALLRLQRWEEAASALRRAIELNPEFVWSHYNLGEALSQLEDWDGAVKAYQGAKKLKPDLPNVNLKLANATQQRSHSDTAQLLNLYLQAIEENPEDEKAYLKALELKSDDPELYVKLGDTLSKQNRQDEAILAYHMATELKQENVKPDLEQRKISLDSARNSSVQGCLEEIDGCIIKGWVWDISQPDKCLTLIVYQNNKEIISFVADQFREDLQGKGISNSHCGFAIRLPLSACESVPFELKIVVKDSDFILANSQVRFAYESSYQPSFQGYCEPIQDIFFRGWVLDNDNLNKQLSISVYQGHKLITQVLADIYRQDLYDWKQGTGTYGYVFAVPEEILDNQEHSIHFCFENSVVELENSPVVIKQGYAVECLLRNTYQNLSKLNHLANELTKKY